MVSKQQNSHIWLRVGQTSAQLDKPVEKIVSLVWKEGQNLEKKDGQVFNLLKMDLELGINGLQCT